MSHGAGAYPVDDPDKKKVPGYPQDMWMNLDAQVRPKAEHHGLRSGWAAAMMGMMTLVRVLPPAQFDEIVRRKANGDAPVMRPGGGPPAGGHEHHHPPAEPKKPAGGGAQ